MHMTFGQQLTQFLVNHWWMVGALVVLIIWAFYEEFRHQAGGAQQMSSQQLTYAMNREGAIVVDVRDAQSYRAGHIVHAMHIPAEELDAQKKKLQKYRSKPIVLVDEKGQRVSPLIKQLKAAGFESVSCLRGGMQTWGDDKMPVVQGK